LHKGSLNDVYQSIKHGYPDKGMQSWAIKYNPKEISLLASFVKSIRGTNPPNAKPPQGDLFTEALPVPVTDSAKSVKGDSARSAGRDPGVKIN
jgi:cytochrome c oxidase cbb3-type subunit 3